MELPVACRWETCARCYEILPIRCRTVDGEHGTRLKKHQLTLHFRNVAHATARHRHDGSTTDDGD